MKLVLTTALVALLTHTGCSKQRRALEGLDGHGTIQIDGSSTVYPILEATAEEFQKGHFARVTIGVSGTGGGFKKLCQGEIVIVGASRPITAGESTACAARGIEYIEIPIAYDGIVIVTHPSNHWADAIEVDELRRMWEPAAQGRILRWSQVRPGWPDLPLRLFGAGVDSGTYDYFTAAVVGREHASRGDFTSSEDDNVLVQGIVNDPYALGFFGYAYYAENRHKLKVLPVDAGPARGGAGPVTPTPKTVADGTYRPLSRPVYLYVERHAADQVAVQDFVAFYFDAATDLVTEAGYIPLPDRAYALGRKRFEARTTGSLFSGRAVQVGNTLEERLAGHD